MMTYIENFHCVWFKIYNDKLVQHNKAILKEYKSKENKLSRIKEDEKFTEENQRDI